MNFLCLVGKNNERIKKKRFSWIYYIAYITFIKNKKVK